MREESGILKYDRKKAGRALKFETNYDLLGEHLRNASRDPEIMRMCEDMEALDHHFGIERSGSDLASTVPFGLKGPVP